jgi:hypothetical protein
MTTKILILSFLILILTACEDGGSGSSPQPATAPSQIAPALPDASTPPTTDPADEAPAPVAADPNPIIQTSDYTPSIGLTDYGCNLRQDHTVECAQRDEHTGEFTTEKIPLNGVLKIAVSSNLACALRNEASTAPRLCPVDNPQCGDSYITSEIYCWFWRDGEVLQKLTTFKAIYYANLSYNPNDLSGATDLKVDTSDHICLRQVVYEASVPGGILQTWWRCGKHIDPRTGDLTLF